MDHYLDLRLLPDPEFPEHQLRDALFAKLHRALVQLQSDDLGISYPDADERAHRLGGRLRLHGSASALERLMAQPWLAGMRDHLHLGAIAPVPAGARHRQVQRVQAKSSPERLRRRQMRRHGLSAEEARARIPDSAAEQLKLPFLELASRSTGQRYRLFLRHGPLQATPIAGPFNAYGLSPTATVPWF